MYLKRSTLRKKKKKKKSRLALASHFCLLRIHPSFRIATSRAPYFPTKLSPRDPLHEISIEQSSKEIGLDLEQSAHRHARFVVERVERHHRRGRGRHYRSSAVYKRVAGHLLPRGWAQLVVRGAGRSSGIRALGHHLMILQVHRQRGHQGYFRVHGGHVPRLHQVFLNNL